jgi:hypothetical protein
MKRPAKYHPKSQRHPIKAASLIHSLQPNPLLNTMREPRDLEHGHHLLLANHKRLRRHEPPQPLTARRRSQTPLIGPVVLNTTNFINSHHHIQRHTRPLRRIIEMYQRLRQLLEKWTGRRTRGSRSLHANSHDGSGLACRSGVHEMHLGLRAHTINQVLRGEVDVPARQVDGLIVEFHGGERRKVFAGVLDRVGGAEGPVVEGAGYC